MWIELHLSSGGHRKWEGKKDMLLLQVTHLEIISKWFFFSFFVCHFPSQLLFSRYFSNILVHWGNIFPRNLNLKHWILIGSLCLSCRKPEWRTAKSKRGKETKFLIKLWVIGTWFHWDTLRCLGICVECFTPEAFCSPEKNEKEDIYPLALVLHLPPIKSCFMGVNTFAYSSLKFRSQSMQNVLGQKTSWGSVHTCVKLIFTAMVMNELLISRKLPYLSI